MEQDRAPLSKMSELGDLEGPVAAGRSLTRAQAERVAACPDLPSVGLLGELARTVRHANRVTFVRVCEIAAGAPFDAGDAGEVRITACPETIDAARAAVRLAVQNAKGLPVTAYALTDLLHLTGRNADRLGTLARLLLDDGLEAVADVPLDAESDPSAVVSALNTIAAAGLSAPRATVTRAALLERLAAIECVAAIQRETGAFKTFAPLPRFDLVEQPSTGYDDVRTVALARLMCADVPSIQVDWPLYGPKLAQVAIAFGADDIDRVSAFAAPELGRRRSPREEMERHIRMAFAEPVERDGRHGRRP